MPVECKVFPVSGGFQCVVASTAKNSLNGKKDPKESTMSIKGKLELTSSLQALSFTRPSLLKSKEYSSMYGWYTCETYIIKMS